MDCGVVENRSNQDCRNCCSLHKLPVGIKSGKVMNTFASKHSQSIATCLASFHKIVVVDQTFVIFVFKRSHILILVFLHDSSETVRRKRCQLAVTSDGQVSRRAVSSHAFIQTSQSDKVAQMMVQLDRFKLIQYQQTMLDFEQERVL